MITLREQQIIDTFNITADYMQFFDGYIYAIDGGTDGSGAFEDEESALKAAARKMSDAYEKYLRKNHF